MPRSPNIPAGLYVLSLITRLTPKVPGAGRVCNLLGDAYLRRRDPGRIRIQAMGFELRVDPSESACQKALTFYPHLYDREEFTFLRNVLRPGGTFVDAGAHIGIYSLFASRLVADAGRVLAIEAVRGTYDQLVGHIELNGARNVTARQIGLSGRSETLNVEPNPSNTGGNRLSSEGSGESIRCIPLLEFLVNEKVTTITALKLDIEGMEHPVLKAFLRDADRSLWPAHVIVETNRLKGDARDPVEVLREHGYQIKGRASLNTMLSLKART